MKTNEMKLSIITINYNNLKGLKQTVASVNQQDYQDFEYLIIDGGSTDGALEFITEHSQDFAYWCSEKDKGIYNAMNKGIKNARGEYLIFLNSGDCLAHNHILQEIAHQLTNEDIVYGDLICQLSDGSFQIETYPDRLDIGFFMKKSLPHPATFIRKTKLEECPYDEELKIVSDWKFWVQQIVLKQTSYKHIAHPIAIFQPGGVSSNLENCNQERALVFQELFPGMVYNTLQALYEWQEKPLYPIIAKLLNLSHRTQKRIKPLLKFFLKLT